MYLDARRVPEGQVVESDVCIIGAGPAGITIGRTLAGSSLKVCILESGGPDEDAETQALAEGEVVGRPYYPLNETRYRVLGGSSNRWAGWCRPLEPIDLEERDWVPNSGWPIDWPEIKPYLEEAADVCQLEHRGFDTANWPHDIPALYGPHFIGSGVETSIWQCSPPTKFGMVYRDELKQARNVSVYLYANATELQTDPHAQHVTSAAVACLNGRRFRVKARAFVIAAGAIETARLLLASNAVKAEGLGNEHDLVGRYFMEHPHVVTGRIRVAQYEDAKRPFLPALDRALRGAYSRVALQRPSGGIKAAYTLRPDVQRRERLLNFSAHLTTGSFERRADSGAYHSLKLVVGNLRSPRRIAEQIKNRSLPAGMSTHLKRIATNLDEVGSTVIKEIVQRPTSLEVFAQSEQCPSPESRVTLSETRDVLGMQRPRLEWRLNALDKWSIKRSQELLGERLEAAGLGILEPAAWLVEDDQTWGASLHGGHHHLGTARMSRDPAKGVVDAAGRVHGMENLYVSDSAVFPTGGYANPLLTIVALALRSARHLRTELSP